MSIGWCSPFPFPSPTFLLSCVGGLGRFSWLHVLSEYGRARSEFVICGFGGAVCGVVRFLVLRVVVPLFRSMYPDWFFFPPLLIFFFNCFNLNNFSLKIKFLMVLRVSCPLNIKHPNGSAKDLLNFIYCFFLFWGLACSRLALGWVDLWLALVLFSVHCLLINCLSFLMKFNKSSWLVTRVSCPLSVGILSYVCFPLLLESYFIGPIYGVLLVIFQLANKFLHILIRVSYPLPIDVGLMIGFGDTDYRFGCKGILPLKYFYHFGFIYVSYKFAILCMSLPKGYGWLKTLGPVCDTGMKSTWWSSLFGVVFVRCDPAYWNVGCGDVALECRSFGSWLCWLSISFFFLRPCGVSALSCSMLFAPALLWSLHDDRFDDLKDEDLFSQVAALRLYHFAIHLCFYISCYIVTYALNHRGLLHPM